MHLISLKLIVSREHKSREGDHGCACHGIGTMKDWVIRWCWHYRSCIAHSTAMCGAEVCWRMERWDRVLKATRKIHWSERYPTFAKFCVTCPAPTPPQNTHTHSPSRPLGASLSQISLLDLCFKLLSSLTSKKTKEGELVKSLCLDRLGRGHRSNTVWLMD